jgi:hypothetical protein
MTTTIASAPDEHVLDVGGDRIRWRRLVVPTVVVIVVLALVGAGAGWWFLGGAHLQVGAPDGGATTTVGTPRNFGIELTTTGGEALLLSARPISVTTGMTVTFFASNLKGSADGLITGMGLDARPLRGTRANGRGPDNATFMTVAVTAPREGFFRLRDLEITYKAGARTRHTRAHMDQCILALEPAHHARATAEITRAMEGTNPVPPSDFLVAEYVDCIQH